MWVGSEGRAANGSQVEAVEELLPPCSAQPRTDVVQLFCCGHPNRGRRTTPVHRRGRVGCEGGAKSSRRGAGGLAGHLVLLAPLLPPVFQIGKLGETAHLWRWASGSDVHPQEAIAGLAAGAKELLHREGQEAVGGGGRVVHRPSVAGVGSPSGSPPACVILGVVWDVFAHHVAVAG